jgi:formate/nitrite transporter FocA (FNT family)
VSRLPISPRGHQADLWMVSITIYTVVILINNIKIAMHVRHWTGLFLFSVIGCSLAPYLIYVWISNYTLSKYVHGTVIMSFRNPTTYLVVTLITIVCIIIVSLAIYITFHTNKMAKKLRLKMLR